MNKLFSLSALGLLGLAIGGCSMQDQTLPTTAMAAEAPAAEAPAAEAPAAEAPATEAPAATDAKAAAPTINGQVAAFSLPDTDGKTVEVGNWDQSKATVIMFVATQCPVSNAYNERMAKLANDYTAKGVRFVGVNSNKQEDVAEIAEHSKANGFIFPVLKDKSNLIADDFDAKVTPEIYVVNAKGELAYHGQIDNSQNETKVKTRPLVIALDAILAGEPVTQTEAAAFGCSIKRVN